MRPQAGTQADRQTDGRTDGRTDNNKWQVAQYLGTANLTNESRPALKHVVVTTALFCIASLQRSSGNCYPSFDLFIFKN